MADLVLGPLLRHVGERDATIWVETDAPCTVEVLGCTAPTFTVHNRHYALVLVEGLPPRATTEYAVRLDGATVWPLPDSGRPPSVIHTVDPSRSLRVSFGSCRMILPPDDLHSRKHGVDALRALADRGARDPARLPDLLVLVGDQIYADELSEELQPFVHTEGKDPRPPNDSVADYEEYARLYGIAWGEPETRWLLSTVPSAMIFDDHDVRDDWNTSAVWRDEIKAQPWWMRRIVGALGSYWVYQHLGNLTPDVLAQDGLFDKVRSVAGDAAEHVDAFAEDADGDPGPFRWSFARDIGNVRLIMVDTRAGRVVTDTERLMADAEEWNWCVEQARGARGHLLIASSLPWLLPKPIHDLEGWNEAVCRGAWGRRWRGWGEKIRQGADLEHWASFRTSFNAMAELLKDLAARPDGPASVVVLSGDVHYSYLAEARFPNGARVWQAVCSPVRNPLGGIMRRANAIAFWRPFTLLGEVLRRSTGVRDPDMEWRVLRGPWFDNALATIELTGTRVGLRWERSVEQDDREDLDELGSALLVP